MAGFMVILLVGGIVFAVIAVSRSSLGHGFGASTAIYQAGADEGVYRAFYREYAGGSPIMEVSLAVGVDPARGRSIGCGVVREGLVKANLPTLHWIVFAANGEPVADSEDGCP